MPSYLVVRKDQAIFRKDFSEAVKDKVMLVISQKLQQFDISLDPPELGNMQVRVNLQGEQATVNFVVQNQQAKDALEQNMQKLIIIDLNLLLQFAVFTRKKH